ncbi:MAG: hypothetical protein R3Y50_11180 [Rikenellaceae bacterium]
MLLLSVSEFRANVSKYLQMAMTERIAIRSKAGIFNITPNTEIRTTNPSPSGDPYFENKENLRDIEIGMQEAKEGKYKFYNSEEELKDMMGL